MPMNTITVQMKIKIDLSSLIYRLGFREPICRVCPRLLPVPPHNCKAMASVPPLFAQDFGRPGLGPRKFVDRFFKHLVIVWQEKRHIESEVCHYLGWQSRTKNHDQDPGKDT
jgi:hypothetical protein